MRTGPLWCACFLAIAAAGCDRDASPAAEVAPREPARPVAPESSPTAGEARTDFPGAARVTGGRIYVPTHSHIYIGRGTAEDLAVTLSIHNVSTERSLSLEEVRYYDTSGKLLQDYLEAPVVMAPLQTVEYFVPAEDRRGGSGANFVVRWHADSPVVRPLIEAVMIRTGGGPQAFAFSTRGIEIRSDSPLPSEPVGAPDAPKDPAPADAPDAASAAGETPPPSEAE